MQLTSIALLLAFAGQCLTLGLQSAKATTFTLRSANTCGDPTTAIGHERVWSPEFKVFIYRPRPSLINSIVVGNDLQLQGIAFLAFLTQALGTVPMYLGLNTVSLDRVFVLSPSGTVPTFPSGYTNQGINFFVYPTQVCNSVPLFESFQASGGKHFYSVDPDEITALAASGYVSQGTVGFVLPPTTTCGCDT